MADDELQLRPGDRVVATRDLRGVPAGTRGTVTLQVGIDWRRYRVRFDNGVELGSLDTKSLERSAEPRPRWWRRPRTRILEPPGVGAV